MKIGIGTDHAAIELKDEIKEYLVSQGHEVVDYGIHIGEKCDYPAKGEEVAHHVANDDVDCGVLICGTGIGISISANKVHGIRAAVCSDVASARLCKQHNNANIIAFGARIVGSELAKDIVDAFLNAEFEGGRHARRVEMIMDIEGKN